MPINNSSSQTEYLQSFENDKHELASLAIDTILKYIDSVPHPFVPLVCADSDECLLCKIYNPNGIITNQDTITAINESINDPNLMSFDTVDNFMKYYFSE